MHQRRKRRVIQQQFAAAASVPQSRRRTAAHVQVARRMMSGRRSRALEQGVPAACCFVTMSWQSVALLCPATCVSCVGTYALILHLGKPTGRPKYPSQ